MSKDEIKHIDELLSCYLDGELTKRQHTEVKRLFSHDSDLVRKLGIMRKQKLLLSAIPSVSAPATMLDDIKASLERKLILDDFSHRSAESLGAKHLMFRHSMTAAIVLVLLGTLAYVVFQILGPGSYSKKPVISSLPPTVSVKKVIKPEPVVVVAAQVFTARLEFITSDVAAMSDVVSKAIYNNDLFPNTYPTRETDINTWQITGPIGRVTALLDEMHVIWDSCQKTQFTVYDEQDGSHIVIDGAMAKQVVDVFRRRSIHDRILSARSFSEFNQMHATMDSAKDGEDKATRSLPLDIPVPRPHYASGKQVEIEADESALEKVSFTIVVKGL
jgi:hypothetical protein